MTRLLLRAWARRVPPSRRDRWLEEWLAELDALERRPTGRALERRFRALRFVWGARAHAAETARLDRSANPVTKRTPMMMMMASDLRFALRTFRRAPAFAMVAVLTLALGVGASTLMFSVLDGVALRPLPYERAEELVMVGSSSQRFPGLAPVAPADFADWRRRSVTFAQMIATEWWTLDLVDGDRPARISSAAVSGGFFEMLGATPQLGRGIDARDEAEGAEAVVVLSHGLWERRYGSDPSILGSRISTVDQTFTVVGVMPASFVHPEALWSDGVELWLPTSQTGSNMTTRSGRFLQVMGRLRPGVSLEAAREEMAAISASLAEAFPASNAGRETLIEPLRSETIGDVGRALGLLMAAVGLLLLIACVNVANLFMARAADRRGEIAVRTAIGAGAGRIRAQLLTEGVVLSLLGGVAGVVLAYLGVAAFRSIDPVGIPRVESVTVDARVLTFSLIVSVLTGVAFALVPALRLARPDALDSLRAGGRAGPDSASRRFNSALVAVELALAVVLLVGAGLFTNSFLRLQSVDPGFDAENAVTMSLTLNSGYATREERIAFFRTLAQRIEELPDVAAIGYTSALPFAGDRYLTAISFEDREVDPADPDAAEYSRVSEGYFAAMGIEVVVGRSLGELDDARAEPVALVNEAFARRYWPGEDPVGRKVATGRNQPTWYTVVGVVEDVNREALDAPATPELFLAALQVGVSTAQVVARAEGDLDRTVAGMREAVRELDATLPVEFSTMEAYVVASLNRSQFYTRLFGGFALLALLLAGVGVYGTMSYTVTQRTRELGIRLVLGAEAGQVTRMVARQGLWITAAGLLAGLVGATLASQVVESFLFGVSVRDPLTYAAGATFLALVAMAACWLPARRAGRADPIRALQSE